MHIFRKKTPVMTIQRRVPLIVIFEIQHQIYGKKERASMQSSWYQQQCSVGTRSTFFSLTHQHRAVRGTKLNSSRKQQVTWKSENKKGVTLLNTAKVQKSNKDFCLKKVKLEITGFIVPSTLVFIFILFILWQQNYYFSTQDHDQIAENKYYSYRQSLQNSSERPSAVNFCSACFLFTLK